MKELRQYFRGSGESTGLRSQLRVIKSTNYRSFLLPCKSENSRPDIISRVTGHFLFEFQNPIQQHMNNAIGLKNILFQPNWKSSKYTLSMVLQISDNDL